MKILCVLLPHFTWRCEVRGHPNIEGKPAIVTYTEGSQKLVLDHSPGLEGLIREKGWETLVPRYRQQVLLD